MPNDRRAQQRRAGMWVLVAAFSLPLLLALPWLASLVYEAAAGRHARALRDLGAGPGPPGSAPRPEGPPGAGGFQDELLRLTPAQAGRRSVEGLLLLLLTSLTLVAIAALFRGRRPRRGGGRSFS